MSGYTKVELEFPLNSSPQILFEMISTPSGLSEWFADDVNIKNGVYTFFWNDSEETAKLLTQKKNEYIKFHWEEHDDDKTYLELRIKIDPLTSDVALVITDFAEEGDEDECADLWESQIHELSHRLGAG